MNSVGIGKLIVDNKEQGWNFPHFHIVVVKDKGTYVALCMELGTNSYSEKSGQEAFEKVVKLSLELLDYLNKEKLFDQLLLTAESEANDPFWKEYRIIETELAKKGMDLGNASIRELKDEIENLRRELNKQNKTIVQKLFYSPSEEKAA